MQIRRRRSQLSALGFVPVVMLAGCGGDADDPVSAPPIEEAPPPADEDTDQDAGGTTMRVDPPESS